MHKNNYCSITMLFDREIDWKMIRLIWIAFYKNEGNKMCYISKLPKDLIKYTIALIGNAAKDENVLSNPNVFGLSLENAYEENSFAKLTEKMKMSALKGLRIFSLTPKKQTESDRKALQAKKKNMKNKSANDQTNEMEFVLRLQ